MNRTLVALIMLIPCAAVYSAAVTTQAILPGTQALTWPEQDMSDRLMDGAHQFIDAQIQRARSQRSRFWNYDSSSVQNYEASVAQNRQRLQTIIGAVDTRLPARMERFGDDTNPSLVAETTRYRVFQVRWPVLEGVYGEGLLVRPKGKTLAHIVVVPDADQSPEQVLGLSPGRCTATLRPPSG